MIKIENKAKQRLEAGEISLGVGLRQARTVDIGKAMKTADYDWLFIDMEHNTMDIDTATQIAVAAQDAGITPLVRVPGFEHYHATRVLDGGAQGIVVPHVDDAATAERMVSNCRYPPIGKRSVTGALPQLDFGAYSIGEMAAAVNDATLLVIMLETPQAIENADAIAAIPGVDALLIGTNDLCMEMGRPGAVDHPDVLAAYQVVVSACQKHGKHAGMGGVYKPEVMKQYVEMGVRMVLAGSDLGFLMSAAKAQATAVRNLVS
ncbi:MAG TPA: aldolase/citrate lyase family protein [Hyphomicrobiaceae bacterium]|nr:aldolase/citrate lyase family protein [Hyphomicrobiaceae bacterium]